MSSTILPSVLYSPLFSITKWDGLFATTCLFLVAIRLCAICLHDADGIPTEFWHKVPQIAEGKVDDGSTSGSRNISRVFAERELHMVIFWGSQSGRAEMIAKRFAKSLRSHFGLRVLAADLDDYDHKHLLELRATQLCGFILSTYGDGDPSDNANGLWQTLGEFQSRAVDLKEFRYIIFGLGNSQYRSYNRVATHVDTILRGLGATRYGEAGNGDDADGSTDSSFHYWREATENLLKTTCSWTEQDAVYYPAFKIEKIGPDDCERLHVGKPSGEKQSQRSRTLKDPQPLPISQIYPLWNSRDKMCLHIELQLGSGRLLKYKTGDYLAIWPVNPEEYVNRLLSILQLQEERNTPVNILLVDATLGDVIPVPSSSTYEALFRHYLEICGPVAQDALIELASLCANEQAREKLLHVSENIAAFDSEVSSKRLTLVDILERFVGPSAASLPMSFFLERLKPMQPRQYSISSSSIVNPHSVSFTVSAEKPPVGVELDGPLRFGFYGLATTYLRGLLPDSTATTTESKSKPLSADHANFRQTSSIFGTIHTSSFKLPLKSSTPIIMVGAGTGVAPFRAFIQERVRRKEIGDDIGKTLVFMGFRHPDVDYIYQRDWETARETLGPTNCQIWTAFSRYSDNKLYVQDCVREHGREVLDLLENPMGCRLYICGSAAMARGVIQVLVDTKMVQHLISEDEAALWLRKLRQSKQILEDVWS